MKTRINALLVLLVATALNSNAQQIKTPSFSDVNLNELRKTVVANLLEDNLIEKRKADVYLFLRDSGIFLNGYPLEAQLSAKYQRLLDPFELGTGPYRTVLLSQDCTAVGDFMENSFHGKSKGRLRIEYTSSLFNQ